MGALCRRGARSVQSQAAAARRSAGSVIIAPCIRVIAASIADAKPSVCAIAAVDTDKPIAISKVMRDLIVLSLVFLFTTRER